MNILWKTRHFLCLFGVMALGACTIETGGGRAVAAQDAQEAEVPSREGEVVQFAGSSVELQTTTDGRHTFVSGYVGDQGPFNFLIDTGSSPNAIDEGLAEAMGLEVVDQREVMSGGTVPMQVDLVEVPEVRLGGLSVHGAHYITMPMAEMSGGDFHGMLGMDLFKELTISYDPQNSKIAISTVGLDPDAPGIFALELENGGFRINADVAGHTVPMHVDTGSPSGFTMPATLMDTLPLQDDLRQGMDARLAGGSRTIHHATLDGDITLGTNTYSNPAINFMSQAEVGNLGNAVINQYVLSIDQKNNLLALQSTGQPQVVVAPTSSGPRRIGIQFRGRPTDETFAVTMIVPESLGAAAGFNVGDVLVVLNDEPISSYSMRTLGGLFRSDDALRFEVMRDGTRHNLEIG